MHPHESPRGHLYGLLAFFLWGLVPFYWKQIQFVPSEEILAHRIVWSAGLTFALLLGFGNIRNLRSAIASYKVFGTFVLTSVLIAINWLVYIWGVNHGQILECSLGYFILPLVSVFLGVFFLNERLRRLQAVAVAIAFFAVVVLAVDYGQLPWISLVLATSMSTYGLLRKTAVLESLDGLFVETVVLLPFAIGYLVWVEIEGRGHFLTGSTLTASLLFFSGAITTVPLLLFNAAARKIPLSTLGIMQYVAPTLQFLIGVLAYHEPLKSGRFLAFIGIWAALALYTLDGLKQRRKQIVPVPPIE